MEPDPTQERQQAHAMLDMLPAEKLNAVRSLLEVMLDPVSRAIANAPVEDEPLAEEEEKALGEAREWLQHNKAIPHEQVLAELGITQQEIDSYKEPS